MCLSSKIANLRKRFRYWWKVTKYEMSFNLSPLKRLFLSKKSLPRGKAFLVIGPEHSGTRMLTGFFCDCGCAGTPRHQQGFDRENPRPDHKLVVWRRSIPHGQEKNPNIGTMYALLKKIGYETKIVGIVRDKFPNAMSQIRIRKAKTEEQAGQRIDAAIKLMQGVKARHKNDYISVSYADFVKSKNYRKNLAKQCGLEYSEKQKYFNADEKYKASEN